MKERLLRARRVSSNNGKCGRRCDTDYMLECRIRGAVASDVDWGFRSVAARKWKSSRGVEVKMVDRTCACEQRKGGLRVSSSKSMI